MAKHTYGFPAGTPRDQALASAREQATADGYLQPGQDHSIDVVETDAHRDNGEYVVVIRTASGISIG